MIRTISLRQPLAHAAVENGCAVIGKYHRWDDKRFGLQCSTQGGDNSEMRATLVRAGLLPALRRTEEPPKGHVFASAKVLARVAAMPTHEQLIAAVYDKAAAHMTAAIVRGFVLLAPDFAHYYVLVDVQPCRPTRWRGVMSCFPVPDEVFR